MQGQVSELIGQWYSLTILIVIEVMIISVSLQQPFTPVIDAFIDNCQNASLQQGRRKASRQNHGFSLLNAFVPAPRSQGKSMGTGHVFDRRCQSRRFACRCTLHSCTTNTLVDTTFGPRIYRRTDIRAHYREPRVGLIILSFVFHLKTYFLAQGRRKVSRPKLCLWAKHYCINRQLVCGQRDTVHQPFIEVHSKFLPSSLVGQRRAPYWYLCK
jgi:hypothetical protein